MPKLAIETLVKQIHASENEIEAIECKIQFADLKTTYPNEYAEMRTEQVQHRQQIIKCENSLHNLVSEKNDKPA